MTNHALVRENLIYLGCTLNAALEQAPDAKAEDNIRVIQTSIFTLQYKSINRDCRADAQTIINLIWDILKAQIERSNKIYQQSYIGDFNALLDKGLGHMVDVQNEWPTE